MSACPAMLMIKGEAFPCDWEGVDANGNHRGWAHTNRKAEAVWAGTADDEYLPGSVAKAKAAAPEHDPYARECIRVGVPTPELHDRPCPACRGLRALADRDPDLGSAADGRPNLPPDDQARVARFRSRIPDALEGRAAARGLHPDKQDFPIGLPPTGADA